MWRFVARPLLFRMDPEWAHYFSMNLFSATVWPGFVRSMLHGVTTVEDPRLSVNELGLSFRNPVGLAAGFDKDARWFHELATLGFSHIEVGTLTGQAQPGNAKKRLFRLSQDRALLNCLGFNNRGSAAAEESLRNSQHRPKESVLGINIGLTKKVADLIRGADSIQPAVEDYLLSFRRMYPFADYITINVSSPNTPGLRDLQHPAKLGELIGALRREGESLAAESGLDPPNKAVSPQVGEGSGQPEAEDATSPSKRSRRKPILVKLAPDLTESELDETLETVLEQEVSGLIATNTTISSAGLTTPEDRLQKMRGCCPSPGGGFSGRPLTERSREFIASVYRKTEGRLPLVGVGGIMNGDDAWQMIGAGATLLQVYTGFVYGGPLFVRDLNRTLLNRLDDLKLSSIQEAVGRDV